MTNNYAFATRAVGIRWLIVLSRFKRLTRSEAGAVPRVDWRYSLLRLESVHGDSEQTVKVDVVAFWKACEDYKACFDSNRSVAI